MANDVSVQNGAKGLSFQVPAHLVARIKEKGLSNIAEKSTVNQLTFGGKVWATQINGEKKLLQRRNEDGDLENIQILRVVVLDYAKQRGRAYYEGQFDANNVKVPDCFSDDGKRPHVSVAEPKHSACETCPMSVKGSKVQDGKEMVACQQNRLLAVVPAQDLNFPAMRMKLAVTSDWDKQDEEAAASGWYGWSNYTDLLRANGLDFTGALVTRMRFSSNVNYPKIQFARGDFLEEDEFEKAAARAKSEEVQKLLTGFTPAAPAAAPAAAAKGAETEARLAKLSEEEAAEKERLATEAKLAAEYEAKVKAAEAKAEAEAEAERKAEAKAKAAAKKAAAEAQAAAKAAPAVEDDGGAWDEAPKAKADAAPTRARAAKPEAAAAPTPVEVPAALAGIMGEWGE